MPTDSINDRKVYLERDTNFSTCYDFEVTKIPANELLLSAYINSRLSELERPYDHSNFENNTPFPKVKIIWTEKKAELMEQIYAWIAGLSILTNW